MTSHDQGKMEEVHIQNICHLSDAEQVELIADNFCKISNQYSPINPIQIILNPENENKVPLIESHKVHEFLKKIKNQNCKK